MPSKLADCPLIEVDSIADRYVRAVQLTAPKLAADTPAIAVEGYWLNDSQYYFLAEKYEPALGRVVATPSIVDAEAQRVNEVVSLKALASLLTEHSGQHVDMQTLSSAEFDMPSPEQLAISVEDRHYLVDVQRQRVIDAEAVLDEPALYSPDGRFACLVTGNDLLLKNLSDGTERKITPDGAPHNSYGQESESCLAAVSYRKRRYPLGLWSPDSQWFLTHRIDERAVPELALAQHVPPGGGRPVLHHYKYPLPGDPMPVATCVAIHVASGRVLSFEDVQAVVQSYSPLSFSYRMAWFGKQDTAYFLRFDRYSKQADLVRLDLTEGTSGIVLSEATTSGYLEFHQSMAGRPNVRTLDDSNEVIWFSERDGWGHLYLYDASTGALKNRITRGEWLVRDIVHIDKRKRKLLFTACGVDPQVDPARRTLCEINLDGSGFEVLLAHNGDIALPKTEPGGPAQDRRFRPFHAQSGLSADGRFGLVRYASVDRGNVFRITNLQRRSGFDISATPFATNKVTAHPFRALAADRDTRLHGVMFFPSNFDERRQYPVIDYIYPGPQIAWQPQSFGSLFAGQARALAELGFVTFMLDTRGMPFRSRALHQIGYGELLEPALADHAAVVRQLCERHSFLDGDRIGIFGQSGGGLATARALFDYGTTFKVGVAVCGNHDNGLLAAMWSDKYRGRGDRTSWAAQENAAVAHKLTGKLLLISGEMDEVVHVAHTLVLIDALVRANRDFDLLIVPNEGHAVLLTSGYVQRRVWDYFVRNLLGEIPPPDFEIKFEPHELARQDKINGRERDLWR